MMYCKKCGNQLPDESSFCPNCGTSINDNVISIPVQQTYVQPQYMYSKPIIPGNGLSIAGMVLGIIACFFSFVNIVNLNTISIEYRFSLNSNYSAAFAFGYVLIPSVLALVGLPLSISGMVKKRSGKNISGLILNSISLIISIFVFIYIVSTY